jgi:hypothetical protein
MQYILFYDMIFQVRYDLLIGTFNWDFLILESKYFAPDMLGEQIAEFKGKVIGQRVLDVEGPTMETSLSFTGNIRGTSAKETITFVGRPTYPGVLHGEGHGVIMAGDTEMATFTAEAFGRISPSGSVKWRGAHFTRTASGGKLAFLNNTVEVFESEIDTEGNVLQKTWEWK